MKPVALPPGSARQADQFAPSLPLPCPGGGMNTISRMIFLIGLLSGPLCSVASSSPPHSLTISTRCGLRAVRRPCRWRYESGSDAQGSWPRSERPRSLPVEFRGRAPWRSRWTSPSRVGLPHIQPAIESPTSLMAGLNCSENRAAVLAPASLDCEAEMGLDTRLRLSCRPPTLL